MAGDNMRQVWATFLNALFAPKPGEGMAQPAAGQEHVVANYVTTALMAALGMTVILAARATWHPFRKVVVYFAMFEGMILLHNLLVLPWWDWFNTGIGMAILNNLADVWAVVQLYLPGFIMRWWEAHAADDI